MFSYQFLRKVSLGKVGIHGTIIMIYEDFENQVISLATQVSYNYTRQLLVLWVTMIVMLLQDI